MRPCARHLVVPIAATAIGLIVAPAAAANPTCTNVGAGSGTATLCQSPGNAQLSASPPDQPDYPYPWDDLYWGPALLIGPIGGGLHPGGGGHR